MTLAEAKHLKWGTMLRPSKKQGDIARNIRWALRDAMFLGLSRNQQNIVVIVQGRKVVTHWSPIFWMTKPEAKR